LYNISRYLVIDSTSKLELQDSFSLAFKGASVQWGIAKKGKIFTNY